MDGSSGEPAFIVDEDDAGRPFEALSPHYRHYDCGEIEQSGGPSARSTPCQCERTATGFADQVCTSGPSRPSRVRKSAMSAAAAMTGARACCGSRPRSLILPRSAPGRRATSPPRSQCPTAGIQPGRSPRRRCAGPGRQRWSRRRDRGRRSRRRRWPGRRNAGRHLRRRRGGHRWPPLSRRAAQRGCPGLDADGGDG